MTSQTFARMLRSELDDVVDFFEQLKGADLDEALTESDYPGGRPWSARDHLAHLVQREVDFLLSRSASSPRTQILFDWLIVGQHPRKGPFS